MKKSILFITFILVSLALIACDPTTTQVSLNSTLTQSTIPVTWIQIYADSQEICMGEQVTFTTEIQPSNATNQNYTISIDTNYLNFVGTSQLIVQAIGEDSGGETMETIVTITSDDNSSITDTAGIYIHYHTDSGCPVS